MGTVYYGECPKCGRIKGFETVEEAKDFERQCQAADLLSPRVYTAPYDPRVSARL